MQMCDHEDSCLINLKKGESSALTYYFNRYKDSLFYFATKLLKNHPEVAEEIVSEAFVKLWNKREDFEHNDRIKSFLYIVVKNACLTFLSSSSLKYTVPAEITEEMLVEDSSIFTEIVRAELLDAVSKEIDKLPDLQRKIVHMSHVNQYEVSEISQELGLTANAIYANYSRAVARLRRVFYHRQDWWY